MKSTKRMFVTILSSACLLSMANLASAQPAISATLNACQPIQVIQIANGLSNATLSDPGMTKATVLIKYYSGNNVCWQSTLDYAKTDTFSAGAGCGCTSPADKVDIQPIARPGDKMSAYAIQPISIAPNKSPIQISLGQGSVDPIFDVQSGLVVRQGIMKVNMQTVQPH